MGINVRPNPARGDVLSRHRALCNLKHEQQTISRAQCTEENRLLVIRPHPPCRLLDHSDVTAVTLATGSAPACPPPFILFSMPRQRSINVQSVICGGTHSSSYLWYDGVQDGPVRLECGTQLLVRDVLPNVANVQLAVVRQVVADPRRPH